MLTSPCTGFTSTSTCSFVANLGAKFENVTVFSWPWLITEIDFVFTIAGFCWTVSVILMPTSWESPEFLIVTATQALIVAIVGVAVGAAGAGAALWASIRVKRVRDAQRTLLGGGRRDLIDFAVSLQGRIDDLHRAVDEVAAGLARVDRRVDATVANTAIVRYDAYEDAGGHQSASLALLDSARTGVVVTAIQGRDYARIYMKELDRGRASVALSPEEQEAVERAMGRGR